MNQLQSFRIALRALRANKMRTTLTILGVVIGVGAVVALMAIGNGATASITSSIQGIGSNLVSIMPARISSMSSGQAEMGQLNLDDYEILDEHLSHVAGIAPVFQYSYLISQGKETLNSSITATTEDYLSVNSRTIGKGRNLTANDRRSQLRTAVIGSQIVEDLFGGLDPLGRSFKINDVSFTVVGVLEEKGTSIMGNEDSLILIPLETGYDRLFGSAAISNGAHTLSTISLSVDGAEYVDGVISQSQFLLRRTHQLDPSEESDFSVFSQSQILSALSGVTTTLTIFLGAIAAISLLVGGIGIMNIMLVSVTERTREIGLRKAVGAKRSQILTQFLIETVTLSLLGGILGILLGVGIAGLVTVLGLITAKVSLFSVLLSFSFALLIGVFFGIYPAYRAASLHPMEALRYE